MTAAITFTASPAAALSNNEKAAFDYFLSQGLPNFQAAGIVGNLVQESNVNPNSIQSDGPGRGIAQWSTGGRWDSGNRDSATNFANSQRENVWSLELQLEFIWFELTQYGYGYQDLRATTNVDAATVVFEDDFEICGQCEETNRINYAREALAAYGNDSPGGLAPVPGQLVAIGNDGGVYHEVRNPNGSWTGFKPVTDVSGGVMKASDVSITGDPDGSSQLVAIGADGYVYHEVRRASGVWTGFQPLAGVGTPHMAASAVAITADPDGSAQVVAIGDDGNVYHEVRTQPGTWTGFQPLPGIGTPTMAATSVSIAADPDGSAQLVVVGADGYVYHEERRASGVWTGFQPVAGVGTPKMAASAVSITGDPDGSAQLVAIGNDGNVYHEVRTQPGTWTGFQPVAGVGTPKMAASAVSITGDPDGSAQLVAIGNDGNVYHEVRTAPGSWTGFQPVAGIGTPKMAASAVSIASVPGAA
jgi:hypothetical protein